MREQTRPVEAKVTHTAFPMAFLLSPTVGGSQQWSVRRHKDMRAARYSQLRVRIINSCPTRLEIYQRLLLAAIRSAKCKMIIIIITFVSATTP